LFLDSLQYLVDGGRNVHPSPLPYKRRIQDVRFHLASFSLSQRSLFWRWSTPLFLNPILLIKVRSFYCVLKGYKNMRIFRGDNQSFNQIIHPKNFNDEFPIFRDLSFIHWNPLWASWVGGIGTHSPLLSKLISKW